MRYNHLWCWLWFWCCLNKQKITLYGLNAPEVRGDSKELGIVSRDKFAWKNIKYLYLHLMSKHKSEDYKISAHNDKYY